jgi:hypothetical protein
MSLHTLAGHLQSAGRGDDKVLVHMTPGEVSGLQSLAMAHGGSLTINPQTGLPEAGFLSRLLPLIAGFALGPAGLGLSAMQAGLAVGAVGTAATGSLGKGLMMGLGAYGGAGLGAGLSATGTVAPSSATPALNAQSAATQGMSTAPGAVTAPAGTGVDVMKQNLYGTNQGVFSNVAKSPTTGLPGYTAPTPQFDITGSLAKANMPTGVVAPPAPLANPQAVMSGTTNVVQSLPTQATVDAVATVPQTQLDKLGAGFKQATGSVQGLKDLYAASEAAAPYAGYAGLGSMALGSYYDKLDKQKGPPKESPGLIRPYTYERTQNPEAYDVGAPMYAETPGSSRERNYFTEKYTALTPYEAPGPEYRKAAEGGVMGLAAGGAVETMSAQNALSDNTMYPQSQLQTPMYSNPMMQRPMPQNVISQGIDTPVNQYTGEMKFASGGPAVQRGEGDFKLFGKLLPHEQPSGYQYAYDPKTMQFSQTGGPGAGAVTGGMKQPVGAAMPAAAMMPAGGGLPAYTPPPIPAYQSPEQQLGLSAFYPMMEQRLAELGASQGYAAGGGISHLGDYSDGGRLLKGPGDGVSDSIPAVIGQRQPARLADGEFVVPARIVSELGNGSTEAGARKLYAMMDRVQKARRKTVGKDRVAANTRSEKYLPA